MKTWTNDCFCALEVIVPNVSDDNRGNINTFQLKYQSWTKKKYGLKINEGFVQVIPSMTEVSSNDEK